MATSPIKEHGCAVAKRTGVEHNACRVSGSLRTLKDQSSHAKVLIQSGCEH